MGQNLDKCASVEVCGSVYKLEEERRSKAPVVMQERTYCTSHADEDTALPISARSQITEREPFEPIWSERLGEPPEKTTQSQPPDLLLPQIAEGDEDTTLSR